MFYVINRLRAFRRAGQVLKLKCFLKTIAAWGPVGALLKPLGGLLGASWGPLGGPLGGGGIGGLLEGSWRPLRVRLGAPPKVLKTLGFLALRPTVTEKTQCFC